MSLRRLSSLFVLFVLFASPIAHAQDRRPADGAPPVGPRYDLAAERTIAATVTASFVFELDGWRIVTVTVEGASLHLILGPDEFLKKQQFAAPNGTSIDVTGLPGSQVNGEPAMLVRELKVGAKTFTLRDRTGKPAWNQ